MGGQSFRCPHCERWFLARGELHDHLVGKHQKPVGFTIKGTGPVTRIEREAEHGTRSATHTGEHDD